MKALRSFFCVVVIAGLPHAALAATARQPLQPETFGSVRVVTGGVGASEEQAIKAMARDFDLFVTFARSDRAYLANVDVRVVNARGKTMFETTTLGPTLLAELPDGRYTMEVRLAGWNTVHHAFGIARGSASRVYVVLSRT
jgi:hypothetical protein